MKSLVFDIEANGFNPDVIFCIVIVDVDTGETYEYDPQQIDEAVAHLQTADKLIGHNIIGYDLPVIHKIKGVDLSEHAKVLDTLVLSRLFNPTREGGHSLDAWGQKLGYNKIKYDNFEYFEPEMMTYCVRDTKLNAKVFKCLRQEARGFSKQSIELEHGVYSIIQEQIRNGFKLNVPYAMELVAEITAELVAVESEVHLTFKPVVTKTKIEPSYTKIGALSKMGKIAGQTKRVRLSDEEYTMLQNPKEKYIIRTESTPFNLGSRKQIGEYLVRFGWKPVKLTPTGQPIVDESTLEKVKNIPEAQLIAKYLMLQKRVAQIKSWLESTKSNDRVYGYVNSNGAVTGRMTHSEPNMAQIPSSNSPYGKECRSCWTVEDNKRLVGIDASGLELRMLAHYMNDEEYTHEILNGDIHTANQKAAGLESRNQAKTFIYAFLYGAGDAKIGSISGGNRATGRRLKQRFLTNTPSLATLKDRVSRASKKGWLKGLDGRKLFVRSEHSALNTLLQGAGAIVMKEALVILNKKIIASGVDAKFVANVHDEWQIETSDKDADTVGQLGIDAIVEAGQNLNMRCPLDGDYNVGYNWSETH